MKRALLTKIKVQKAKRMWKRAQHRGGVRAQDPKDLRGAKGVLLENATAAVLEEESSAGWTIEPRHPPVRIRVNW